MKLTPLRPVSARMLTMNPEAVHARERVEKRDGSVTSRAVTYPASSLPGTTTPMSANAPTRPANAPTRPVNASA